ncbi:unnamed protein product, partial [Amoebophrya sp. A120]
KRITLRNRKNPTKRAQTSMTFLMLWWKQNTLDPSFLCLPAGWLKVPMSIRILSCKTFRDSHSDYYQKAKTSKEAVTAWVR